VAVVLAGMEEAVLHWLGKSVKYIQLLISYYSYDLIMIIGLAAAWSVPPPLINIWVPCPPAFQDLSSKFQYWFVHY